MVPRVDGGEFDLHEYYEHSERYRCVFERYLPHLTALVNCIYWDPRYSRLVTKEWLRATWSARRGRSCGCLETSPATSTARSSAP